MTSEEVSDLVGVETEANGAMGRVVVQRFDNYVELCTGWEGPVPMTFAQAVELAEALIAVAGPKDRVTGITDGLARLNASGVLPDGWRVVEWCWDRYIGCPEEGAPADDLHLHVVLNNPSLSDDGIAEAHRNVSALVEGAVGDVGQDRTLVEWSFPWGSGTSHVRHWVE